MFPHLDITMTAHMWGRFIFAGKIAGAAVAIGGLFYHPTRRILAGVKKVTGISDNMDLLLTNHLPHIQTALDTSAREMTEIKSDVRNLGTQVSGMSDRIDDTKAAVHTLGVSFLNHLESTSAEKAKKVSRRKRAE
jgi:hypothetical protein